MCDASTALTAVGLGLSAASTAYGYTSSQKARQSQDDAALREMQRQKRIQATQSSLINQQEQAKEKGRRAFVDLQPKLDLESTQATQAQATDARNQQYQQATAGPLTADPLQGATQTAVVDSPAERPLAVRAAYDAEAGKSQQFSSQQAQARAFLDALADAQRQAGTTINRGAEQIGMYGDFVSGSNRPLQAWEAAKNGQAVFNAASNAAYQQGVEGQELAGAINSIGQLGYAYGTRSKNPKAKPVSYQPIS